MILIMIPNHWSKNDTIPKAWKALKEYSGRTKRECRGKWAIYWVHPDTYCENVAGNMIHPKDHPPIEIDRGSAV